MELKFPLWLGIQALFFFLSTIRLNDLETGAHHIQSNFEWLFIQFSVFGKLLVLLVSLPEDIFPSFC